MSNAVQIRDASDVIAQKKREMMKLNYLMLFARGQLPKGGIPSSDLTSMGFTNTYVVPTGSILANVVGPADCPTCLNQVEYFTTETVPINVCGPECDKPYTNLFYQQVLQSGIGPT